MGSDKCCRRAPVTVALALAVLVGAGDAFVPLLAEGQAGFWNQLVVGADKAYNDRIGGLTLNSNRPIASLIDRETPTTFETRWDVTAVHNRLAFMRGSASETLSFNPDGSARFNGAMRVYGVLRVTNLDITVADAGDRERAFVVGTNTTSILRLGNDKISPFIQSVKGNLALNPHLGSNRAGVGVVVFSVDKPRKELDVHSDAWLEKALKLGASGETTLTSKQLRFANGGGWADGGAGWITSLKEKPVHFGGGAVFGKQLGIGIEISRPDFRLQVHDGHFVVTQHVSTFLKGVTTYIMPSGSFIKAYDYTRKKLQKLRITGTKILINPGQNTDGRTCIGCSNPEHHLQSEGNMYVNGNVFVNKDLHVTGHMHIDKVITSQVFIHSRPETPEFGRGLMIGNDLPNSYHTRSNMRIGYNKNYGWIQSHQEVPIAVNPIGGKTCIGCTKLEKEDVELEVKGDTMIDGEVYVATLRKTTEEVPTPKTDQKDVLLLQENETPSLSQITENLKTDGNLKHMDLVHAWASAAKLTQGNRDKMQAHRRIIRDNANVIHNLETKIAHM